jgi:hypothetical protein
MDGQGIIRMILGCIILLSISHEDPRTLLVHLFLAHTLVVMSDHRHHPLHQKLRKRSRRRRKIRTSHRRHHLTFNPTMLLPLPPLQLVLIVQNKERKCQRRSSLLKNGR